MGLHHLVYIMMNHPAAIAALVAAALTGSAVAADPSPEVVEWLDELEARGGRIESLQADVIYQKFNPLLSDRQTRIGEIDYLAADPESGRSAKFAVHFEQLIINDALRDQNLDWVFDGAWLVEKQVKPDGRKLFLKRRIVPPGEVFDPLRIDGPFPIPIGQERERVLARFDVQIIEPDEENNSFPHDLDQPPLHLRLTPRFGEPGTGDRESFEQVDLWFDRETLLPLRVHAVDDSEVETTVTLTETKVNGLSEAEIAERFDTSTPPPGSGWEVEVTPWEE